MNGQGNKGTVKGMNANDVLDMTTTWNEFNALGDDGVAEIVRTLGMPKSAVFLADGGRRFFKIAEPNMDDMRKFVDMSMQGLKSALKVMYDHGIKTVLIPGLSQNNFKRDAQYLKMMVNFGFLQFCTGREYLDFFREMKLHVRIYGDMDFVDGMGYPQVREWAKMLDESTKENGVRSLFIGIGDGMREEEARLSRIGIEFFKKHQRAPTDDELVVQYFGKKMDYVDIFIHPTEVRDSDAQPILIGGRSEMYFPLDTYMNFDRLTMRTILYDYLFMRVRSSGSRSHENSKSDSLFLNAFYKNNIGHVLGVGERSPGGGYWIPKPDCSFSSG